MRACTARSKPIKRCNLSDKNVQTFSFRAGGFRTPGPTRAFRGHTPGVVGSLPASRGPLDGMIRVMPRAKAPKVWRHTLGIYHFGRHQGDVCPLSVARAAMRGASLKRLPVPLQLTLRAGRVTATQRDQSTQCEHAVRMRGSACSGNVDASGQPQLPVVCDGYPWRGEPPRRGHNQPTLGASTQMCFPTGFRGAT